jgi:hypothetical protein
MATQLTNDAPLSPAAALAIESLTLSRNEIIAKLNLLYFQIDRMNELIRNNPENLKKVALFQSKVKEMEVEKDGLNQELLENQIAQQDIEENEWANGVDANAVDANGVDANAVETGRATNVYDAEMLDDFKEPNAGEPNAVEANAGEPNAVEANAVEANAVEEEDKLENCCLDCGYEWRDGFKEGWEKAMQYFEKNIKKTLATTVAVSAKICSNCNVDEDLLKCNGTCNGVEYYCSEACQKAHWKAIHRFECEKL